MERKERSTLDYDFALVGGGLQNALLALALAELRPAARVLLLERDANLGGNHTWSWHEGDAPAEARPILQGLADASWPGYRVSFPGLDRSLSQTYSSTTGASLAAIVERRLRPREHFELRCNEHVSAVRPYGARLSSGEWVSARCVIDARGPQSGDGDACGYQKFVGLEVELADAWPWDRPMLMDATVPQVDGYRFFYSLPLGPRRALVEDTYFSESPRLDVSSVEEEVRRYIERNGGPIRSLLRVEKGVLPLPLTPPELHFEPGLLVAGYGGGWFHPTTGYSFPVALRLALFLAARGPEAIDGREFREMIGRLRQQQRFCIWLNRLLFRACAPEHRWQVLERFYRLPAQSISRFYSLQMTPVDRLRVVCGRPPEGIELRRFALQGASA